MALRGGGNYGTHHEDDAAKVHAACEELAQVLLDGCDGGRKHLAEDGLVARPEVVAEQVLRRGAVHEQLVRAAEQRLVVELLASSLRLANGGV